MTTTPEPQYVYLCGKFTRLQLLVVLDQLREAEAAALDYPETRGTTHHQLMQMQTLSEEGE